MERMRNAECGVRNVRKVSMSRIQDSVGGGRWAVGSGRWAVDSGRWAVDSGRWVSRNRKRFISSFIPHPPSFILAPVPSSLQPTASGLQPTRRGISLLEVLFAIGILLIGLLGVAAIIPLGQLALWETAKADRCGACGRAAMREIQVSRLLDFRYWYWTPGPQVSGSFWGYYPPFNLTTSTIPDTFLVVASDSNFDSLPLVIDPLGRAKGMPEMFGQAWGNVFLPRRTLRTMPLSPTSAPPYPPINEQLFYWSDDLPFDTTQNSIARPTVVKTGAGTVTTSKGDYSWFFTVMPVASEAQINAASNTASPLPVAQRRLFNVSVAVCYKRNFQIYDGKYNFYLGNPTTTNSLDGEHVATISANTGFPGMGIGGGTVRLDADCQVNVKENQWVMMYHLHLDSKGNPIYPGYPQMNRLNWYRVVGVGSETESGTTYQVLSLMGPDWNPNLSAALVVVPGVIGVYNTTMELDWDPLWTWTK
jgi:hypothetical protein